MILHVMFRVQVCLLFFFVFHVKCCGAIIIIIIIIIMLYQPYITSIRVSFGFNNLFALKP